MTETNCVFCDLMQFRAAEVCFENAYCLYASQDERLSPDGYLLVWNCFSEPEHAPHHAHLLVIPRFDDEPLADHGGRSAIKAPENRRPDPFARGRGGPRSFGPLS